MGWKGSTVIRSRTSLVLSACLLIVGPIVAGVTVLLLQWPIHAYADTHGNTDQYEQGTYVASLIWGGASVLVNQRYGCTDSSLETQISPSTPVWTQVCPTGFRYWHHGIDINLNSGTALYSPVSGVVAEYNTYYAALGIRDLSGQIVYLLHGYAASGVGVGSLVTVGQHVDDSDNAGCPGCSTGPHLHLEVHSSLIGVGPSQSGFWDDINPEQWLQYQGPHAATVSWGSNRLDLFVRGTNGAWHRYYNGTTWRPVKPDGTPDWEYLSAPSGVAFAGQLTAASWGATRIDLFGVGVDGNLWQSYTDDGTNWHGWQPLGHYPGGAALIGTPSAASWGSLTLSVFVRGSDGALYQDYWTPAGWTWESHGGYSTADPTVISSGTNHLDVFILGDGGHAGHTYHQAWTSSTGWQPVGSPCGVCGYDDWSTAPNGSFFVSQPTAGYGSGFIDAFATSADGNLYTKHFNGLNWSSWQLMGPLTTTAVGVPAGTDFTKQGAAAVLASVRGADSTGNVCWWSSSACYWQQPGGVVTSDPATISIAADQLDFFVRGSAYSSFPVYHRSYSTANGWGPWESFGGLMT